MSVLVIGGGVLGTTTAYFLAEAGHQVTLVERAAELAAEGSHANGGMLHASHTEPWNTPDAIRQLVGWIGREDSPLLLRPSQIPNLVGWGLGFLRYSRSHHHQRSTRINTRLALYSRDLLAGIQQHTGIDYDSAHNGIAKIYRSPEDFRDALDMSGFLEPLGVRFEQLDADGLVELEPALRDVHHELAGGIHYPDDSSGDPQLFTTRLGEYLRRRGVTIRLGETVLGIDGDSAGVRRVRTDQDTLTADRYVLAAGVEAPRLVRHLGIRLPIRPVKGYSATLPAAGHPGVPDVPLIDDSNKVVLTRLGERLRVSGTAEFAGLDRSINAHRVRKVIRQSLANLPRYAAAVDISRAEHWACLRPMTMDGPPILGASPVPNLFLNAGPGHLGWTFAAGAARVVADVVAERRPEIDLEGLGYDRFRC